ncbi:unannotated protein [freshwater metagenome]|uniref:Unannotated protein n=1 Tax=freshwater metagenome TaxID=449393 RepID=A0A6J7EP57_9ZZZZ|nr:GNAT family N-acetyltransferase [Actinomycetota bacterium]
MLPPFTAIRSERVTIDRLTAADVETMLAYKNDAVVAQHQAWALPFTLADARRLVASTVGEHLEMGGQLAIRTNATSSSGAVLVGDVYVHPVAGVAHAIELGISMSVAFQGKGLATESVRTVVDALFGNADVHRVLAYVAAANTASLRLFDRCGFQREGTLRDSYRSRDGALISEVLFGLTRSDWSTALRRQASPFDVVAFDADDTLWHSEDSFFAAEQAFVDLVGPYVDDGIDVKAALTATERRNLHITGYGVKAFGLSMIETAATIAGERLPMVAMSHLVELVRQMLLEPVRLLPGVAAVLEQVGRSHRLVLITKGDLIHQSAKVDTSGLAHHFEHVEIVMEKDPATYARVIAGLGVQPGRFCMVGNSVRSDILPVLSLGGAAVHVPYPLLWDLELAPHDHGQRFAELESLDQLPAWLRASTTARGA